MKENKEMGANLAGRVVSLMNTIVESLEGEDEIPPALHNDVQKLQRFAGHWEASCKLMLTSVRRALEEINSKLRKFGESSTIFSTIIRVNSVKGKIAQLETELCDLIRRFQMGVSL